MDKKIISVMNSVANLLFEMKEENDRAIVIVGTANVDNLLRRLIEQSLLPRLDKNNDELIDGDSPLSTFSSRINFTYRFGLIDKEFSQLLHILRKVRNDFAHKLKGCDLNSSPHSERVNELTKHFKDSTLLEVFRKHYTVNAGSSRDFRIIISLLVGLLEMKLHNLPKKMKANPASITWFPKDVNLDKKQPNQSLKKRVTNC